MTRRSLLLPLVLFILCSVFAGSVGAQQPTPLPSQQHAVQSPESVPIETLPPVDGAALRAKADEKADEVRPYRFAKAIDTDFSPTRHGTWERLSSGAWLWRLRIESREALSLSLAFEPFQLPEGAALYVHGAGGEVVHGPYRREDATQGQLWTPIVQGSEIVVEVIVPDERRSELSLRIMKANHGFRPLAPTSSQGPTEKARACNIDVACPRAFPWRDQVRSVGMYSVNGIDVCSGSLINNTNEDGTPYFLTAEHCLQGRDDWAASMVFYWNYEHPTCRPPGSEESGTTFGNKPDQTSTGALLRMSYGNCEDTDGTCYTSDMVGKPDMTLVEIDDSLPQGYKLYLNGWNRRDFAPSEAVSIHHPQTEAKRITFEQDQTSITGLLDSSGDTHIHVDWDEGTTERGSSGSPLLDPSHRTVGVLSGGGKGCEIEDWYGRIHKAWDGGGTPDTRLRDWLDPTDSDAETLDGYDFSDDATPPAQISDFSVENATDSTVTLTWTAPGDDGMNGGAAAHYELRYRTDRPIFSKSDFAGARWVSGLPAPADPGTVQSNTIEADEDSTYYFGIVAHDRVLNTSPLAALDRNVTPVQNIKVASPSPNPVRTRARTTFAVEQEQRVQVRLFDAMGRRVQTILVDTIPPFQAHDVTVDVSSLSSGIYFLRVQGQTTAQTKRIAVVR